MTDHLTLPDFTRVSAVPEELVDRYGERLPESILTIWRNQGFGTAAGGFLKVVNPDDYTRQLGECLPAPHLIPVFTTSMGDVLVFNGEALHILLYRFGTVDTLGPLYEVFGTVLADENFLDDDLYREPYPQAVALHGVPAHDECFGFTPILALGGREEAASMQRVKLIEHIHLIHRLAGPLPY